MSDCSNEFAGAFILEPRPSKILAVWRGALLCLLALAALGLPVPWPVRLLVAATVCGLGHVASRRRRGGVIRMAGGRWSVPSAGVRDAPLGSGSQCSGWWVELDFAGHGRAARLVLLRDQVGREDWRRLTLAVREARPGGV